MIRFNRGVCFSIGTSSYGYCPPSGDLSRKPALRHPCRPLGPCGRRTTKGAEPPLKPPAGPQAQVEQCHGTTAARAPAVELGFDGLDARYERADLFGGQQVERLHVRQLQQGVGDLPCARGQDAAPGAVRAVLTADVLPAWLATRLLLPGIARYTARYTHA